MFTIVKKENVQKIIFPVQDFQLFAPDNWHTDNSGTT